VLEKDQYSYGFDPQSGEYGNLVSKGIIDPTKVVRGDPERSSVASLLITTEAMIAEVPKKGGAAARRCRAAAWAAWTSKSPLNRNPGSNAGVFASQRQRNKG
jgi:hypothetical protein